MDHRDREDRDDVRATSDHIRTVSSDVSPETSDPDPIATGAGIHTKVDLGIRGTAADEEDPEPAGATPETDREPSGGSATSRPTRKAT